LAAAALIPSAAEISANSRPPSSRMSSAPRPCSVSSVRSAASARRRSRDSIRPSVDGSPTSVAQSRSASERRARSSEIDSLWAIRYSHGRSVISRVSPDRARKALSIVLCSASEASWPLPTIEWQ
jgi:hypothetical protein